MELALGKILLKLEIFILKCLFHSSNQIATHLMRGLGGMHKEVDRTIKMKDLSMWI